MNTPHVAHHILARNHLFVVCNALLRRTARPICGIAPWVYPTLWGDLGLGPGYSFRPLTPHHTITHPPCRRRYYARTCVGCQCALCLSRNRQTFPRTYVFQLSTASPTFDESSPHETAMIANDAVMACGGHVDCNPGLVAHHVASSVVPHNALLAKVRTKARTRHTAWSFSDNVCFSTLCAQKYPCMHRHVFVAVSCLVAWWNLPIARARHHSLT